MLTLEGAAVNLPIYGFPGPLMGRDFARSVASILIGRLVRVAPGPGSGVFISPLGCGGSYQPSHRLRYAHPVERITHGDQLERVATESAEHSVRWHIANPPDNVDDDFTSDDRVLRAASWSSSQISISRSRVHGVRERPRHTEPCRYRLRVIGQTAYLQAHH